MESMNNHPSSKPSNKKAAAAQAATMAAIQKAAQGALGAAKPSDNGITKRGGQDYHVDPRSIIVDPEWNDRFDWGDIDELARQIKELKKQDGPSQGHGLLNKIRVQRTNDPQKFRLIDGERRMLAITQLLKAGEAWEFGIPVWIEPKDASDIDLMVKKIVANDGKKFLPLEEASAFNKLRKAGLTIQQICDKTGRASVHVVQTLALVDAAPELQEAVKAGKIGSTLAKNIAVAARGDADKQKELTKQAVSAGKDKKAQRDVKAKVEAQRVAKAEKQGRVLKIRAMTDEQLSDLGATVAKWLVAKSKEAAFRFDVTTEAGVAEMQAEVAKDERLTAVFTLGVLQGLKAAAGIKTILDI